METDALYAQLQTCPQAEQKGSQWSEPGQETYVKCWRSGITALLFQRFTSMKKGMGYLYFEKLNSGPFLNYRLLCWSLRKSRVTLYGPPEIKALLLHDQGACIPSCEVRGLLGWKTSDYMQGQEARLGHLQEGPGEEVQISRQNLNLGRTTENQDCLAVSVGRQQWATGHRQDPQKRAARNETLQYVGIFQQTGSLLN